MENSIESASYESKSKFNLPEGAEVIKKSHNIRVKEIENGFIICKSYDVEYQIGERKDYSYYTKEWYAKENPLTIKEPTEEKSLADKID